MAECKDCIHFCVCSPYTAPNESYPEVDGCKCFRATADVVPKSEEGAECPTCYGTGRIGTTNWLTKNMTKKQIAEEKAKAIAEHEQRIKTEVAREIFEEIEELAKIYTFPVVKNGVVEIAKEPFWCIEPNDLAELKKKYT